MLKLKCVQVVQGFDSVSAELARHYRVNRRSHLRDVLRCGHPPQCCDVAVRAGGMWVFVHIAAILLRQTLLRWVAPDRVPSWYEAPPFE